MSMDFRQIGICFVLFLLFICCKTGTNADINQELQSKLNGNQRNYYLDATLGNDINDGMSPERAWKSVKNLSNTKINPGDSILFKKGEVFREEFDFSGEGTAERKIIIGSYGESRKKPIIQGSGNKLYAVRIYNSSYVTMQDIEIVNKGMADMAGRTGLTVECTDYGISRDMLIDNVTVRDVNGSKFKSKGGGCGILIFNRGKKIKTRFDNMIIENCHIKNCQRDGIRWAESSGESFYSRRNWFPNQNPIVRNNLIEGVPGDGILPIGCENALVEYNVMRDCPKTLENGEAAAGIWPWSCDNTIIQFNDVSGHKACFDGQAYDADYNCRNTVIQYNYSHENFGGLVLICNDPNAEKNGWSIGTQDTKIRYNISINDGLRDHNTSLGIFGPCIHFSGDSKNTLIEYNIIHAIPKPDIKMDRTMIEISGGRAWAINPIFRKNIFYAPKEFPGDFQMGKSQSVVDANWYLGTYMNLPEIDKNKYLSSEYYQKKVLDIDPNGYKALYELMEMRMVGGRKHHFIKKEAIEAFFKEMESNK